MRKPLVQYLRLVHLGVVVSFVWRPSSFRRWREEGFVDCKVVVRVLERTEQTCSM
jgi:hypothetical protein